MEPTVVRSSSLNDWPDCPRRWAARNLRTEIGAAGYQLRTTVAGIAAAIGTAVHAGAAVMLTEKAKTGRLPSIDVATDAARDSLREKIAEGVVYDDEAAVAHDASAQAVRMTRAFHEVLAPQINPVLVERRLRADARPGIVLSGQADVIAHEPDAIVDNKTGKFRSNCKAQIGSYGLLRDSHGGDVKRAREAFVQRVSLKKPQPRPQMFEHDIEACEAAADAIIDHIANGLDVFRHGRGHIAPGDPWAFMANPNSKLCGPKYCGAWGTSWCREHREENGQ